MNNKILFLDESGDHNLKSIDDTHPIFVLAGIIIDKAYAEDEMQDKVNHFKKELFGTTDIHLHTADFTRQKNGFERMTERGFCNLFYKKINELLKKLDFKIIACAIKKQDHFKKYGPNAHDPYHLSLHVLIERFWLELGNDSKGVIIAEGRDQTLNNTLERVWMELKQHGTDYRQASDIRRRIDHLVFRTKTNNLAGLEVADIIVTPIARNILNRSNRIDMKIINEKMRKSSEGKIEGFGLVTLPKN